MLSLADSLMMESPQEVFRIIMLWPWSGVADLEGERMFFKDPRNHCCRTLDKLANSRFEP
jgi:hypothetical protein